MAESTNWERADRAATALQVYHDVSRGQEPFMGSSYGDEGSGEMEEAFADLLTDLMHLASRCELEFTELVSGRGQLHRRRERGGGSRC
jgi:hypothetical protein